MKATTKWLFRQKNLNYYSESYFEDDWDYFIYLHLNDKTRLLHLYGTLIGLSLLPWATYRFFAYWEVLPVVIYTFFYYGVGFISHFAMDGQISQTWKQILRTYKQAVKMNFMTLTGKYGKEEERFSQTYPETLWVFNAALSNDKATISTTSV